MSTPSVATTSPLPSPVKIKEWPILKDENGINFGPSPNSKTKTNLIYCITVKEHKEAAQTVQKKLFESEGGSEAENKKTEEVVVRRYFGSVYEGKKGTNTLGKRSSNYRHHLNQPAHKRQRTVVDALRKADPAAKISLSIVDTVPQGTSERELLNLEADWQDKYSTRDPQHGLNTTDPRLEPERSKPKKK